MGVGVRVDGIMVATAAVLIVGGYFLTRSKGSFDPTSDNNLAYRGANAVGAAITGDENFSLGSAAYDVVESVKPVVTKKLNPASNENVVYQGVNKIGERLTGDKVFSLGGWLYDVTHSDETLFSHSPGREWGSP